jgi:hypothetical protein
MKENNWMAEAEQFADALFGMTGKYYYCFYQPPGSFCCTTSSLSEK